MHCQGVWSSTLFLTFSCAEYESADIESYLRKVNAVPDTYPIGKLCCEDPILSYFKEILLEISCLLQDCYTKGESSGQC